MKKNLSSDVRPDPTQTGLYNDRRKLEASNFGYRKDRDCPICVAKTKALISCAVTAQLNCTFVFGYAKSRFSHDAAQMWIIMFQLSYQTGTECSKESNKRCLFNVHKIIEVHK